MISENEFTVGVSSGENITREEAGRMQPGKYLMMKDEKYPCKVTQFNTAKPGKHGSAKAMIMGKDIFTDK
jgi:translation initiation factor 5A